jgi:hypothetical protein
MYAARVMGTKNLKAVAEKGVESVKKADASLRLCIGLVAAVLVVALCTLAAVLAGRPAHA